MDEYKLLDSLESENIDKVREFAKAMNERTVLMRRVSYIDELLKENRDIKGAVWTTANGESFAIADLEDSHLKNIIPHLAARGAYNNRVRKEYTKRFGELPALPPAPDYFDDDTF